MIGWVRFVVLLAGGLGSMTAAADYLAYAVGEEARVPLPESIDGIDARYLLNLEWGDYDGARSRLGVLPVDNTSGSRSFTMAGAGGSYGWSMDDADQVPVNGIEAIVTDVLNRTGRFRLLERQALEAVLDEQDLASTGRVARPSGAATGNVLGAQYLVQVVVTDYESKTSGTSGGLGALFGDRVPVIGGVGVKSGTGRVGLNFRLIDAETSEVAYSRQVESTINETGLTFGGGASSDQGDLAGFFSSYSRTPIGQAVIAGINKGVYELAKQIGAAAASGAVVKAEPGRIWVNLGAGTVAQGDVLRVLEEGEALIDPETGLDLGSSTMEIARATVMQVEEKFSIAALESGATVPARGDRVESMAAPPSMEFADTWQVPRGRF